MIDVGEGESILLEFPGHAVLIDAGSERVEDESYQHHLFEYLNIFFARRVDLRNTIHSVIVSHPHADHTRHLLELMRKHRVRNLVTGKAVSGNGSSDIASAIRFAQKNNIVYDQVKHQQVKEGGYTPKLLGEIENSNDDPVIRILAGSRDCDNQNNSSLVVHVKYGQASFLLTGDAETYDTRCWGEIPLLLKQYKNSSLLDVDVYKVGHHGSIKGTTLDLMKVLTPKISIISAGKKDSRSPGSFHAWQFGHPQESTILVLEKLTTFERFPVIVYSMRRPKETIEARKLKKAVYCTCWDGDIVISVDVSGTQFTVQENESGVWDP